MVLRQAKLAATIHRSNLMTRWTVSACSLEKIYLRNLNQIGSKMRTSKNEPVLRKSRGRDRIWRGSMCLSIKYSTGTSRSWLPRLNLCSPRRRVELWRKQRTNSKFLTKIYFHIQILISFRIKNENAFIEQAVDETEGRVVKMSVNEQSKKVEKG